MDRLWSAPQLAVPRTRRRARVPARVHAGEKYLGADGGVTTLVAGKFHSLKCWKFAFLLAILVLGGCSSSVSNISTPPSMKVDTILPFDGKIVFVHGIGNFVDDHIYVMNANGSDITDITPNLSYADDPSLSPDGKHIVFTSIDYLSPTEGKTQIFLMDSDGAHVKQLTFRDESSYRPSWSHDGEYVVFLSSQSDVLDYRGVPAQQGYIVKIDDSEERRITNAEEFVNAVSWYQNDDFISVSVAATRYTLRTYIMNLDGVIQKQFPEFIIDGIPVWSPDGDRIVYNTLSSGDYGVAVMKPFNANREFLQLDNISPPIWAGGASWSPDGKYIIFSSNLDGDSDLYIIKSDGSELTQLTNLPGDESQPNWIMLP